MANNLKNAWDGKKKRVENSKLAKFEALKNEILWQFEFFKNIEDLYRVFSLDIL